MNSAIIKMMKQALIAIVLLSLLNGAFRDASGQMLRQEKIADFERSEAKVRDKRFINPFTSFFSIWNALTHMYQLFTEVSECMSQPFER